METHIEGIKKMITRVASNLISILIGTLLFSLTSCSEHTNFSVGDRVAFFPTKALGDSTFHSGEIKEVNNDSITIKISENLEKKYPKAEMNYFMTEKHAAEMANRIDDANKIAKSLIYISIIDDRAFPENDIINLSKKLSEIVIPNKPHTQAADITTKFTAIEKTIRKGKIKDKEKIKLIIEDFSTIARTPIDEIQKGDFISSYLTHIKTKSIKNLSKAEENYFKKSDTLSINNTAITNQENHIENVKTSLSEHHDGSGKTNQAGQSIKTAGLVYCHSIQDIFTTTYLGELHDKDPSDNPKEYAKQLRQKLSEVEDKVSASVIECFKNEKLGRHWSEWW